MEETVMLPQEETAQAEPCTQQVQLSEGAAQEACPTAEPAAEPTVAPVAEPAAAADTQTAALEQELQQLRQEKLRRQLMDEASALLCERGIDGAFAPFVLGETSADTRKRVEQFDRQFASALRRHLAARLPDREPRDFSVSRPAPRRRGIRTL